MTPPHSRVPSRRASWPGHVFAAAGRIGAFAIALGAASALPACRSAEHGGARASGMSGPSSIERLEHMAEQELERPDEAARRLPPCPGIASEAVAEIPPEGAAQARLDLDAALAQLGAPEPAVSAARDGPDEEAAARALRLYIAGRSKLQGGDAKAALPDLEAASKLDPASAEVWRELAEAQLALGRRSAAMTSFQQAVGTGSTSARVYTAIGHESLRLRRPESAIPMLLRAWELKDENADPACRFIIAADLADLLRERGYLRAAAELMGRAADLPETFGGLTRFRTELAELYRRQSDLWRDAGDISCRLGDYEPALEAYAEAARTPTLDPAALVARRVHAALRLGRPAQASLIVLDQIRENQNLVEDGQFALVRFLAESTGVGPNLAAAFREVREALPATAAPTIRARLARAEAAASPARDARELLLRHLAEFPDDDAAGRELLGTYGPEDAAGRSRAAARLTAAQPALADRYAYWLVDGGRASAPYLAELDASKTPASRLLLAYLESLNGLAREARDTVVSARADGPVAGGVRLARVELAAACGDWETARAELAAIRDGGDPQIEGRALRELHRDEESLALLAPIADSSPSGPLWTPTVLLAAELAANQARAADAERWLRSLLDLDPYNEVAHEALIRLYLPGGPLPDQEKLTAAVRTLRESVPSSRTLRYFNAGELMQRQLFREAETTLLTLVEEDIANGSLLNDLVTAWERSISAGDADAGSRAETWLRARLKERPESIFLAGGLARVLATQGRGEEAVAVLDEQLATLPRPEIARLRESIIRESLKKVDEADALARERLARQAPGIDTIIERAELLARQGDASAAAGEITGSLPSDMLLSREQGAKLAVVCARAVTSLGTQMTGPKAAGVRELMAVAVARGARLSPQLHERRLALMAAVQPADVEAMAEAVALIARQYPAAADEAYMLAARSLLNADQPRAAVRVLEGLAGREPAPSPQVLLSWVDLATRYGEREDIDRLFAAFQREDLLAALVKATANDPAQLPQDKPGLEAEFAYLVGTTLNAAGRDELAESAYRRALSLRPDHPWVSNNLGYQLLEDDRDLAEAGRLLETAYRALPEQASVIDSVGWLRYKQRVLEDETGPDGSVVREGALTLLLRAADSDTGRENSVLQEHLGDALWAAGRRDDAVRRWTEALRRAGAEMDTLRRADRLSERTEQRLSKQITQVQAKLVAARNGGAPSLPPPFNE